LQNDHNQIFSLKDWQVQFFSAPMDVKIFLKKAK